MPRSLDEPLKFSSSPKGLYLYGGVGCGKTTLMDLFHDACRLSRKKRVHFHEFMLDVHRRKLCITYIGHCYCLTFIMLCNSCCKCMLDVHYVFAYEILYHMAFSYKLYTNTVWLLRLRWLTQHRWYDVSLVLSHTSTYAADLGHVTNVSRGVPVYYPVFTGTHYTYPGGMARLS